MGMAVSRAAAVSIVVVVGLLGATGWAVVSTLSIGAAEAPTFYGARLGQSASDLRRKLVPPVRGTFRAAADAPANGDLALEWLPDPASGLSFASTAPRRARFEIHSGLVVAIRATLPPSSPLAEGPRLSTTPVSVLSRTENPDHSVSLSILARDCPTHAEEVRALLQAAPE